MDEATGKSLQGMVVSSGQPFGDTVGDKGQHMITQGGLYFISASRCQKLWPNSLDESNRIVSGGVVNRVVCHDPTGVCFFSNWNHEFDKTWPPEIPHCLHWCALDHFSDPTRCSASEALRGGPGNAFISGRFCSEPHLAKDGSTVYVAPHGMLIGHAVQDGDTWHLEMIISYTDGLMGMDEGVSFARKLYVTVKRRGSTGESTHIDTSRWEYFGSELTTDTLDGTKYDVGLDHMWRDAAGYVWFSTFRKHNAGEHVLDYQTGKLLVSFKGFEKYPHIISPYNPSGISVVGGFGEEGAVAIVAVETVPPLPFVHGALFFVDVSNSWGLTPPRLPALVV